MFSRKFWLFLLWPALVPVQAAVDLVTLPTREGTQLTIYNSEDVTIVREHRLLTVKEGVNRIQFSWAKRTWPTSAARKPSTCPLATAWKSTSGHKDITIQHT